MGRIVSHRSGAGKSEPQRASWRPALPGGPLSRPGVRRLDTRAEFLHCSLETELLLFRGTSVHPRDGRPYAAFRSIKCRHEPHPENTCTSTQAYRTPAPAGRPVGTEN